MAALGSALALAVLPLAVHQGQELRAYSLAFFCVALADVSRAWHEESGLRRAVLLQTLAAMGAVYSLYIAFFPLAVGWAMDALASRKPHGMRARRRLIVPVLTILAFLPWLLAVRTNLTRANEMPAPAPTLRVVGEFATGLVADRQPQLRFAASAVFVWSLVAMGLVGAAGPERRRLAVELAAILLASVLFLTISNHWFELRYFWFALWPLAQLVGEGLSALPPLAAQLSIPTRFRIPSFFAGAVLLVVAEARPLAENAGSGRVDWRPLESLGDGWIVRTKWGGSESGRSLAEARPWATFTQADGLTLYRFEKGRLVPP